MPLIDIISLKIRTERNMYYVSIIIFSSDSGFDFIKASETQPSIFAENGSVIRLSHGLHDLFLSTSFKSGGVIILCIPELSLVMSGPSQEFSLGLTSVMFGGLFSEEVVPVEKPVAPYSSSKHPNGSDSSQPPLVGFENEVGIVKHDFIFYQVNYY
jgi:hypothetical protein